MGSSRGYGAINFLFSLHEIQTFQGIIWYPPFEGCKVIMVFIVPIFRCCSSDFHSVQASKESSKDLKIGQCFNQELTQPFKHK